MSEPEPQFIVRTADGKKSKPVSKARILEMHSAGKIGDGATVTRVGTNYQIPIQDFVSAGEKRSKVKPEAIPDPFESLPQTLPPVLPLAPVSLPSLDETAARPATPRADADYGNVFRPPQSRPVKAIERGSAFDTLVDGITAIVTWPIRGFIIPSRGVDETRDYLRKTISWLEGWLRFMHLLTVIFLGVLGYLYYRFVQDSIQAARLNPQIDGWDIAVRAFFSLSTYLWTFFVLMLIQAVLRLVPASLRYWIEATEEARKT